MELRLTLHVNRITIAYKLYNLRIWSEGIDFGIFPMEPPDLEDMSKFRGAQFAPILTRNLI
jgi:hypothetical protein